MRCRAFTLVETIVVVALTTLVSLTLIWLVVYFYKTNAYALEQSTSVEHARRGIEDAMSRLREASYASEGSSPISSAATSSIVFYANIDNDSLIERVSYSLQKGVLYRTVSEPSGNPPTYVGASTATTTVASFVVNTTSTPVFRYYDTAGIELSAPINLSKISSIKTTVVIDVNVNRSPVSFTLFGGATLRNLRNSL